MLCNWRHLNVVSAHSNDLWGSSKVECTWNRSLSHGRRSAVASYPVPNFVTKPYTQNGARYFWCSTHLIAWTTWALLCDRHSIFVRACVVLFLRPYPQTISWISCPIFRVSHPPHALNVLIPWLRVPHYKDIQQIIKRAMLLHRAALQTNAFPVW